jgi:hypothetical protein
MAHQVKLFHNINNPAAKVKRDFIFYGRNGGSLPYPTSRNRRFLFVLLLRENYDNREDFYYKFEIENFQFKIYNAFDCGQRPRQVIRD